MFLAISHDAITISFLSCSTVLRHVVLGLPRLRFPSGCHVRAVLQWLFLSVRSTWPIHFHRLVLTSVLTRLVSSVLFIRSSLEITYGHRIFMILLMQVVTTAWDKIKLLQYQQYDKWSLDIIWSDLDSLRLRYGRTVHRQPKLQVHC